MNFDQHSSLVVLIAGVSFFMLGMTMASDSLQKLAANHIREVLSRVSKSRILAVAAGVVLTVCLQSSGAVTSMLVGLAKAGVVNLRQVMGVIVGTAVGTTLTVQLISFNVSHLGLPIFAIAFTFFFVARKRTLKNLLSVFMGFGLIFFGIELIGISTKVIQTNPTIQGLFLQLSAYPMATLLVSTVFTGFVHSSAVTIGLAMGLASSNLITFYDGIFWMLGANIGTTSTALLASVGGNFVGRQVAWAHCLYKVISVLLVVVVVDYFIQLIGLFPGSVQRGLANAHTLYNVLAAILFLPLIGLGAKGIEKLFPPNAEELEFSTVYIDDETYHSSTLCIAFARRELLRMSDIFMSMVQDSISLFEGNDPDLANEIRKRDSQVDILHHEIKLFLIRHTRESRESVSKEVFDLISFANDLETAADVIDNSILSLGRKKQDLKLNFSAQGWEEIKKLHFEMVKMCRMSISAFEMKDSKLAKDVIKLKRDIRALEEQLKESHFSRLNQDMQATINTSSIHLDLLGDFRRIVGVMCNHAYGLRENEKPNKKRR